MIARLSMAACALAALLGGACNQTREASAPRTDMVQRERSVNAPTAMDASPQPTVRESDGTVVPALDERAATPAVPQPEQSEAAGKQYPYEPAVVELEGVLAVESKFGAPNFGETPKIDRRVRIYVVRLKEPITVGTTESLSEDNDAPVASVTQVQLASEHETDFAKKVGKPITVRGALSKQMLPYDFYPVVLRDAKLK